MPSPNAPVCIEEIIDRAANGMTQPFYCRADNGQFYYVKGIGAGRRSLICEWMAGALAIKFGLDVPDMQIAYVPEGLADLHPEGRDLGSGPVFASQAERNLSEIVFSQLGRVPQQVRRDVVAFDWWTRNADRTMSALGGNPNLLWDAASDRLVVIDHDQALDPDFDCDTFLATHIFRDDLQELRTDLAVMADYSARMKTALEAWNDSWSRIPDEWLFNDIEQTVPVEFDPVASKELLARCKTEDLWRLS